MLDKKIALVVGHTKGKDGGAYSPFLGKTEFQYNWEVAKYLKEMYPNIYDVYTHTIQNYYQRQLVLAKEVNKKDYSLALELHFNSFSPAANGCEMLYFATSRKGKTEAIKISAGIAKEYRTKDRGAKSISSKNDRGYWFLRNLKAPALIVEPFFGSNKESLKFDNPKVYAIALHKLIMANK